jgi:alkylation response protein AidB-like acyl-CoA dehydrogenase
MHFDYSEEHELLRDATRGAVQRINATGLLHNEKLTEASARRQLWRTMAQQGWTALLLDEEVGGAGGSVVDAMVVAEELGAAAFPLAFLNCNLAAYAVEKFGSMDQLKLLPKLADGSAIAVLGFSESCGGWEPGLLQIDASRTGQNWTLQGHARLVPDVDVADLLVVSARSGDAVRQFLVPMSTPGIVLRKVDAIDQSRFLFDVQFDSVVLCERDLLGEHDQAIALLQLASVLTAADSVGIARQLLEMTVKYTKERVAFGRSIASFQAVKHRAADMLVQVEASRAATWKAAVALRDALPDRAEAISIAKFFATAAAADVAGQALQLHGGIGFTWEHDLHYFLKRAKTNEVINGTNAWHRERVARLIGI